MGHNQESRKISNAQNPPPSDRFAWCLVGLSVLIALAFIVMYFGGGGKIWIGPENNIGRILDTYNGPIFIVESVEDAKKLADVHGKGTNYGVDGSPDRDDIRIGFKNLYYENKDDQHLVYGEIWWLPRPWHGYPGDVKWIVTTIDEIQANWDSFLHKNHPDVRYQWHPDFETQFEDRLKPYRYPPPVESVK